MWGDARLPHCRGFFSCLSEDGSVYDDTKYVWMQGRQVGRMWGSCGAGGADGGRLWGSCGAGGVDVGQLWGSCGPAGGTDVGQLWGCAMGQQWGSSGAVQWGSSGAAVGLCYGAAVGQQWGCAMGQQWGSSGAAVGQALYPQVWMYSRLYRTVPRFRRPELLEAAIKGGAAP